jgi:Recombinase
MTMPTQGRLENELGVLRVRFDPSPPRVAAVPEILRLRAQGFGPSAIARSLNRRGVPTPSGRGRWHPDTVKRHIDPGPWREYMRRYRAQRPR